MNHKLIFYCICMLLFTSCIKQINLYTGDAVSYTHLTLPTKA